MENEGFTPDLKDNSENKPKTVHNIPTYESYFNREELTAKDIEEKYEVRSPKSDSVWRGTKNYIVKYYKPSGYCMKNFLLDRIPFLKWIQTYDIKENLAKDIIGGLTIGVIHIPQGMAYALMAGLPPIFGLYVSFWPVVIYSLLGTSRHLSIGTFAITSLMINAAIQRLEGKYYPSPGMIASNSTMNPNFLSNDPAQAKVLIGTALAFFAGLIQILFAILHVGIVTKYLSDTIVSAFTIGASYHIITSQLTSLLGLKRNILTTPFKLIEELVKVFSNIHLTNISTLIISIVSMVFLYCTKEFINERYKAKLIAPLPVDLFVVIFGTLFSYLFKFNETYNVRIVGMLPTGIPTPVFPPLQIIGDIIDSSVNIAIVSFALNISMSKLFAKKYKYDLDVNQDLFAYGVGNFVCSFLGGHPACVALSRCVIIDSVGSKTQIVGIVSSIFVLIIILALGPLFRTLPNACLSSIIAIALLKMAMQVQIFPSIWKKSKIEGLAWLITFIAVFVLDIDLGLYIGIVVSILLIVIQSQRAPASLLGNIPYTDIYESIDLCEEAKEFRGIKIIRYESSVFYANVEGFSYRITKLAGIDTNSIIQRINKLKVEYDKLMKNPQPSKLSKLLNRKNGSIDYEMNTKTEADILRLKDELKQKVDQIQSTVPIKDIILDFSCINYIDSMGVNAIITMKDIYKEVGVTLHLTYCKRCIFRTFKKNGFEEKFDYSNIYPTIHDAVMIILRRNKVSDIKLMSKRKPSINIHIVESQENEKNEEDIFSQVYRNNSKYNAFEDMTDIRDEDNDDQQDPQVHRF